MTYKGQPVAEGVVVFDDAKHGLVRSLPIGPDGTIEHNAIPIASYVVTVLPKDPPQADMAQPAPRPDPKDIPKKYRSAETTDLKADIKTGDNEVKFDLVD